IPGSRLRPAALGISRDSVAGGDRVGRMAGEGVHDGNAEAARVSAGAANGFHFSGGRRGAGIRRSDRRPRSLSLAVLAVCEDSRPGNGFVFEFGGVWVGQYVVRARTGQCGDDVELEADPGNPASVLLLWRIFLVRLLNGVGIEIRISGEGRGKA